MIDYEKRREIVDEKGLSNFLDECVEKDIENDIFSGFILHCKESDDKEQIAETFERLLNDNANKILESVTNDIPQDNEIEGGAEFSYSIEGNDIFFEVDDTVYEEYGSDCDLHDEFFEIGETTSEILEELTSAEGEYPHIKYEGILFIYQIWGQTYLDYTLLCNMDRNDFAYNAVLDDDSLWEDYEEYS